MEYYLPLLVQYEPSLYLTILHINRYCRRTLGTMQTHLPILTIRNIKFYNAMQKRFKFTVYLLILSGNNPGYLFNKRVRKPSIITVSYEGYTLFRRITTSDYRCGAVDAYYLYVECDTTIYICGADRVYIYTNGYKVKYIKSMRPAIYMDNDMPPYAMRVFNLYKSHIQN